MTARPRPLPPSRHPSACGSSSSRRRSRRSQDDAPAAAGSCCPASRRPGRHTGRDPARAATGRGLRDDFGPAWSTRGELPDARTAGRQLLTLALEALAGRRPLSQVQPITSPRAFAALPGRRRPAWCAGGTAPLVLGRVHVCEPVDGVAEVSAVAHRSGRAHAVAARLEGLDGRWRCTALQIG